MMLPYEGDRSCCRLCRRILSRAKPNRSDLRSGAPVMRQRSRLIQHPLKAVRKALIQQASRRRRMGRRLPPGGR